jgi:23S rRNA pseudouridine1911/1915/1917 synthase
MKKQKIELPAVEPLAAEAAGGNSVDSSGKAPRYLQATPADKGLRLDHFLQMHLPDTSRVRLQQMIEQGMVRMTGKAPKSSLKLKGTESIAIAGRLKLEPLHATPEDIPLDVVYEDKDLAVINKPAGMTVHAPAGGANNAMNKGTLVNALLFRFRKLSSGGDDELRPGIVHRLDKLTSGLIIVAKNNLSHRRLAEQFRSREVRKSYLALVHGWPEKEAATIDAPVCRDPKNATRMTCRTGEGREAVSHYKVLRRIESPYGLFALVEVKIDTGRTHQIRVHMSSIGHPVVGDTLYGASAVLSSHTLARQRAGTAISMRTVAKKLREGRVTEGLTLPRNFLHAASIRFTQPLSGKKIELSSPLPPELQEYLKTLQPGPAVAAKAAAAPKAAPKVAAKAAPQKAAKVAAKTAVKAVAKKATKVAPKVAVKAAPKKAAKVAAKTAVKAVAKKATKVAAKSFAKPAPKRSSRKKSESL